MAQVIFSHAVKIINLILGQMHKAYLPETRRNKWTAGVLDQKQSTEKGWV